MASNDILQFTRHMWATNMLRALVENKIFDTIASSPKTTSQIALESSTHLDITHRCLLTASSLGFVTLTPELTWKLTDEGSQLTVDHPSHLRDMFLLETCAVHQNLWMNFRHTLKTGESSVKATYPIGEYFELFKMVPSHVQTFQNAMGGYSFKDWKDLVTLDCVFPSEGTIADIGGGDGYLIKNVLSNHPNLKGILFDLPQACSIFKEDPALSSRLTVHPGDFFHSVPTADAYIVKHILHDWDDERCVKILTNIRKASLEKLSPLFIIEWIIKPGPFEIETRLMDLHMATVQKAFQRNMEQWHKLFKRCGYKLEKHYQSDGSALDVFVVVPSRVHSIE